MFFGFWQFKTTVSLLLLASCLGQELLRTCDRNYCYERSSEKRDVNVNNLRERLNDASERKNQFRQEEIENRYEVFRGVRENLVEISDHESRRFVSRREEQEIRCELDNITLNPKEHTRRESNRVQNDNRVVITDISAVADEGRRGIISRMDLLAEDNRDNYQDVDRSFDETRRTEHFSGHTVERRQNPIEIEHEDRSVTRRLNERNNQQEENRESLRFIDRRENRVDPESRRSVSRRENREIRRKVDNLTANRKEHTHRIRNENRIVIDDVSAMADEGRRSERSRMDLLAKDNRDDYRDVDRTFDETRRTERFGERTAEKRQNPIENEREDRSVTSRLLNERDTQEDANRESRHFTNQHQNRVEISDSKPRMLVSRKENQENRRELDSITSNREEYLRRESNRILSKNRVVIDDISAMTDEGRRSKSSRIDLLAENNRDNYREVDRSFDEPRRTERFSERTVERRQNPAENERDDRSVTSRRLSERDYKQNKNRESLRQYSEQRREREIMKVSQEPRHLNERTTDEKPEELQRIFKERTDSEEQCNRREQFARIVAENHRDNTNEHRRFIERISENERRFEHLKNYGLRRHFLKELDTLNNYERRLDESERLNTNRRSIESLPEENNRQERVARLERDHETKNRFTETELLTEERENLRRLSKRENERSRFNEDLQERDSRRRNINRESLNLNERRLDKRLQRIPQIRSENEQERGQRYSRETLRQLDNRDNKNDISRRLNEKAQRLSDHYSKTKQRELENRREILKINREVTRHGSGSELNENLAELENILNINNVSPRLNNRLEDSEHGRNIRQRLNENRESRHTDEKQDILLDEDIESRRFQREYDLVERHYKNIRQLNERHEELRQLEKRDDDLPQRRGEDQRERNQQSQSLRNEENLNYRDFHNMAEEYKGKTNLSFNKGYMAFGQGALLAYVIMKTLNGKNDIKYNIYQKLQEAVGVMGF